MSIKDSILIVQIMSLPVQMEEFESTRLVAFYACAALVFYILVNWYQHRISFDILFTRKVMLEI